MHEKKQQRKGNLEFWNFDVKVISRESVITDMR